MRRVRCSVNRCDAANSTPEDEAAALAVYRGADPMAETIESLRADPKLYGPLKALSKKEAQSQYGETASTIIHPSLIVGPDDETDRFTYWPARLAHGGDVLAPGDGSDPVQFIDVRYLAEWTIRMAEQRIAGVFNAAGPALPITMREILAGIARGEQSQPVARHAGVDSGRRRPPSRHSSRHRRGSHLPPPAAHRR